MDNKIIICSDHAGIDLKTYLINKLTKDKFDMIDFGVNSYASSDYPKVIAKAAKVISMGEYSRGIFICGSGIGASIVANRFKNVRAGLIYNNKVAKLSRLHNDCNVIVFGARLLSKRKAYALFKTWSNTLFSHEERHQRRIRQIEEVF